jgi:rhamnosyltransferase
MIAAVMVLYHPDRGLLERAIDSLSGQVDRLCFVDNTPAPSAAVAEVCRASRVPAEYVALGANRGLAVAQNLAIRNCLRDGCSHILLLDQDSIVPGAFTEKLLAAERSLEASGVRVAAAGPAFVDRKSGKRSYAVRYGWFHVKKILTGGRGQGPVETDWLIASGTLIRSQVLEQVGMMKDELFIDWVDAEWGLRARRMGLRSFIVPDIVMEHSIGDSSEKLLHYEFNLHSTARNYYIVRNAVYLLQPKSMGWPWVTTMLLRIPKHIAVHSWYSPDRWRSFTSMMRAVVDGLRGNLGPIAE